MRILLNYATPDLRALQRASSRSALRFGGFDRVVERSPADLDRAFWRRNATILEQGRGAGYWLWKPYIVSRALEDMAADDFLFYLDVDNLVLRSVAPIEAAMRRHGGGVAAFEIENQVERMWTKRDCFVAMGCDAPRYTDSRQVLASYSAWRRTAAATAFVDAWLHWAQDPQLVADAPSCGPLPDYPEFRDHRHDQSIFSLLCKQREVALVRGEPFVTGMSWGALARASFWRPLDVVLHGLALRALPVLARRSMLRWVRATGGGRVRAAARSGLRVLNAGGRGT